MKSRPYIYILGYHDSLLIGCDDDSHVMEKNVFYHIMMIFLYYVFHSLTCINKVFDQVKIDRQLIKCEFSYQHQHKLFNSKRFCLFEYIIGGKK